MLGGRSCGYAKYADKDSADRALMVMELLLCLSPCFHTKSVMFSSQTLHGQEVCGSRLKVMTAEPPSASSSDTLRKRIRIEEQ